MPGDKGFGQLPQKGSLACKHCNWLLRDLPAAMSRWSLETSLSSQEHAAWYPIVPIIITSVIYIPLYVAMLLMYEVETEMKGGCV